MLGFHPLSSEPIGGIETTVFLPAIYGTGKYGSSNYGVVAIVVTPAGVSATGSVNTVTENVKETLASVVGTSAIEAVSAGGFEIDITERISAGVSGTGSVNSLSQIATGAGLTGTSSTGSIGTLVLLADSTIVISSVSATGAVNSVEDKTTEKVTGVSATGSINTVTVNIKESLASISSTGIISTAVTVGRAFDFESVKNQYSRRRTIYIARAA
tara:strand:- start:3763 stop:4404 length:642 start_codon:yes stop_codon:yes gene_type:complete